jgi:hypothetical protein
MSPLGSYQILFSAYDGNQNHHTGDLIEHTGLFCHKITNSRYNVPSKKFETNYSLPFLHGRPAGFDTEATTPTVFIPRPLPFTYGGKIAVTARKEIQLHLHDSSKII